MAQAAAWRRAAWEAAVPDAWSAGESHGGPPWLRGGNLMIFPFDGGSPIYFGTKPVGGALPLPFKLPGGGGFGIEGTIGPHGQEAGAGFAGVVPTPGKYPPAKPGALVCEPLKAAVGLANASPHGWGHLKVAGYLHRPSCSRRSSSFS
jgi:hypothetical protein